MSTRIRALARSFLDRREFQPRASVGGSPGAPAEDVWVPLHPAAALDGPAVLAGLGSAPADDPRHGILAGAVRETARAWELPVSGAAPRAIERLEAGRARVVVTGQQPGLLGGPLYTLFKALTALGAAEALEERSGAPHVAVFWVAGEDHDLEEVRSVGLPGDAGATVAFSLPHEADRRPLDAYPVDAAVVEVLRQIRTQLEERLSQTDGLEPLLECYRHGRNLASSFARLLVHLLGHRGLLVLDPTRLRPASRPILKRALEHPRELMTAIERGREEVRARGLRPRVAARFPVFLLEGGAPARRNHLSPTGEGFRVEGAGSVLSTRDVLSRLEREPERFSTGAILRPVVQQACLPVSLAVGGPAELAYFAQLGPVFDFFDLPHTPIGLRFHATLIEGKVSRAMERLGLGFPGDAPDLWSHVDDPRDLVPRSGGPDPETRIESAAEVLARTITDVLDSTVARNGVPRDQVRKLEKSAGKILADLRRLGKRSRRLVATVDEDRLASATSVWNHIFPDGVLQERRWNMVPYLLKYGVEWLEEILAEIRRDPFALEHRWVRFL